VDKLRNKDKVIILDIIIFGYEVTQGIVLSPCVPGFVLNITIPYINQDFTFKKHIYLKKGQNTILY
jgi:hypothetical protein